MQSRQEKYSHPILVKRILGLMEMLLSKMTLDENEIMCIMTFAGYGEMAERLKALVLKTSDAERHRGFESLSLRQLHTPWRSTQEAEGAPLLRE